MLERVLLLLCLAIGLLTPLNARAHTATLSVLVLKERSAGEFTTRWEQTQGIKDPSAAYDLLRPVFPEQCGFTPPRLACGAAGLSGRVGFDGLGDLSTSGIIKVEWANGTTQLLSFTTAQPHVRLSAGQRESVSVHSVTNFIRVGALHIWFGWDHLLFVLGLLWFLESWRTLLKTITAFTIAHSLTLAAASLEIYALPTAPVEAVIALSIVFVAVEMTREARSGEPSFTRRHPWLVAFTFGLLHGFGFASALSDLQIGKTELPIALLCFNIGVELGQLVFVAALVALRPAWRKLERALGQRVVLASHYALGTVAAHWFFERIAAFLTLS